MLPLGRRLTLPQAHYEKKKTVEGTEAYEARCLLLVQVSARSNPLTLSLLQPTFLSTTTNEFTP